MKFMIFGKTLKDVLLLMKVGDIWYKVVNRYIASYLRMFPNVEKTTVEVFQFWGFLSSSVICFARSNLEGKN